MIGETIMITYKGNILEDLKKAGYNTWTIRKERLLSESVLQGIREGTPPSMSTVNRLCKLLNCQPCDLLVYTPDREDVSEN